MAHIPDGVLSAPVLVTGALVSSGLIGLALHRLREADLPQAAVLSAAFFVSSLISVPLGPTSVHLLLNGLMGLLLGWAAMPAIFVALLLQAIFFGFGGLVVLGVNTMNLALPALVVGWLLRPLLRRMLMSAPSAAPGGAESEADVVSARQQRVAFVVGTGAGLLGVALTGLMLSGSLLLSGEPFAPAARIIAVTFVPLALVEGLLSGIVVAFLLRVEPGLLRLSERRHGA
jgi:cobalt/nickel transport system permease protein